MNEHVSGAGEPTPSEEARSLVHALEVGVNATVTAYRLEDEQHWAERRDKARASLHAFIASLEAENEKFAALNQSHATLVQSYATLVVQIGALHMELEETRGSLTDSITRMAASHASLESECAGLRSSLAALTERCNNAEAVIDALAKEVSYVSPSPTNEEIRDCVLASLRAAPDTRDAEPTDDDVRRAVRAWNGWPDDFPIDDTFVQRDTFADRLRRIIAADRAARQQETPE